MSYLIIDDFRLGMDRRKQRVSGVPGALWAGINGHITRGGDFERRKKFVKKYALAAGTIGLAQVGQQLYVFGAGAAPGGFPFGVGYQQLIEPTYATPIKTILDIATFSDKLYVVVEFESGGVYHYYDGGRVGAWDAIAAANMGNATTAKALARKISVDPRYVVSVAGAVVTVIAAVAGTAFTISGAAVNGGGTNDQTLVANTVQSNIAAVAETASTLQITVNGQLGGTLSLSIGAYRYIAPGRISWAGSNSITAAAIAAAINTPDTSIFGPPAGTPLWTATVSSNVVTIKAPAGGGVTYNGVAFTATGTMIIATTMGTFGPVAYTTVAIGSSAGGVDAVAAVSQVSTLTVGGTVDALDKFIASIDSISYVTLTQGAAMGITALTYFGKIYSVVGSLIYFSAIAGPTDWSGTGSGFINIVNQDSNSDGLVGAKQFQGRVAIFSRFNTQIWVLAVDPANNTYQQSVQNTGALSNRSLLQYGNVDTFYYSDSGVRSLRPRDASNSPAVNDIGVAIDTFIQDFTSTLNGQQINRACATIEPVDERYWLALHNRIFVYSFYSGSKINAWTYYDLTDEIGTADITEIVRAGRRTWLRAGDNIYLYGGDTGTTYPNDNEVQATLALPFLSGNKPGTIKGIKGFDCGLSGTWDAFLQPNSNDDTQKITIGTFGESTYNLNKNPIEHPSPLVAITMTCKKAGYASVSNMIIHFDTEDEK